MNPKGLTEADTCTKSITAHSKGVEGYKWNLMIRIRRESCITRGRVIVRGKGVQKSEAKQADHNLFFQRVASL